MNIGALKSVGTRFLGRGMLVARKHSPEILTAVGVVGVVSTVVMASRATLNLEEVIDTMNSRLDTVSKSEVDENAARQVKTAIYIRAAMDITKLYGPAITTGVASIAAIIGAHGIMRRRNVALVAAYKAVESSFSEYRKRVAEELGEEAELDIRRAVKVEKATDVATGQEKEVRTIDANGVSQYARFFDEYSTSWSKTPEYNLVFLRAQQNWANDLLKSRGHLFLNEVYDMLGIPRSKAGAIVGWVHDSDGDNYVDFGMYDIQSDKAREFINGYERSILLDFNVDGVIWDMI